MDDKSTLEGLRRELAAASSEITSATARAERAEAAFRDAEQKYRAIFDSIDEGFCVVEIIEAANGQAADYRFLETNASFERQTGLVNAIGCRMREMEPQHEEHWFERYSRIAKTRIAERFEDRAEALGRWYDVYAFPVGDPEQRRVAILFRDVIARKRAEQDLLTANQLLRTTFDSSLEIIQLFKAVRNDRGAIVDFEWLLTNKQWNDRWGPNAGKSLLTENPGVVASGIWDRFLDVMATGDPFTHEHYYPFEQFNGWFQQTLAKANDGILLTTLEITDRKRAEIALRASEGRFRQFGTASSDVLWIRDAQTLAATYVSAAAATVYGAPPERLLGDQPFWDSLIVPEDRAAMRAQLEQVKRGEIAVAEFRVLRPSDRLFRWVRRTAFPLLDDQGAVLAVAGISSDVTERRLLTDHQGILLAELQHRVRNIMAVIRSIASRSSERAPSVEAYAEALAGRLLALARVQALLTRAANLSVDLHHIVEDEVGAQAEHRGQYEIMGPDVRVSPKAAEVLTLAIHELSTNAVKYGALSVPDGKVTVCWNMIDKRGLAWLSLDWKEAGAPGRTGPDPSNHRPKGFGTELIEGRIPYELAGISKLTIGPDGACCHLEFPLRDADSVLETDAPRPATVFGGVLDMRDATSLAGRTVLIVEDDYYLASDTAAALMRAGANVLGPCPTEAAARAFLATQTPTHAVLDLNLGGGSPRFEIARLLKSWEIPFVFLTGYDPDVIPEDMKDVVRLQKPVDFRLVVETVGRLYPSRK